MPSGIVLEGVPIKLQTFENKCHPTVTDSRATTLCDSIIVRESTSILWATTLRDKVSIQHGCQHGDHTAVGDAAACV